MARVYYSRMANRTIAQKITALETERDALEAAISSGRSGGSSFTLDGVSVTNWRLGDIRKELTRVEKSLQRLYRGGRGMPVDLSYGDGNSDDPYRSGSETLL